MSAADIWSMVKSTSSTAVQFRYQENFKKQCLALIATGSSVRSISKAKVVSRSTLFRWCRENGIKMEYKAPPRTVLDYSGIDDALYIGVLSYRAIARIHGVSDYTVRRRRDNLDIPRRPVGGIKRSSLPWQGMWKKHAQTGNLLSSWPRPDGMQDLTREIKRRKIEGLLIRRDP